MADPPPPPAAALPTVLVLGGAGFIGRNLVVYLVENRLASVIRAVDKALLQTAYLTPRQQAAFAQVEFKQANLTREATIDKAFEREGGASFDYVFNCAALTKYGQENDVYQESVFDLSVKCAHAAAKFKCKRFIELSTAQVYSSDKKPSDETDKCKPWTGIAAMKLRVEEEMAKIEGLDHVIVRPATVYGSSDRTGLMPRLICGAVYKKLDEPMKFLWNDKLALNTVHVDDVVRALWHLATKGKRGEIYNLADKADSTQGSIADLIGKMFGINTGFQGNLVSNLAKLNFSAVTEVANEKHMEPWTAMCNESGITNTPLNPYLDKELLYNNALAVNGSKIEQTGFQYNHPEPTLELLRAMVQEYIDLGLFPKGYMI